MKQGAILLELAILFLLIFARVRNSSGEILNFGVNVTGSQPADKSLNYNRIYLLPYFATKDGFIFAFSAVVQNWNPALIIIYRPQSGCSMSNLKVVGHIRYYPSVATDWRENIYLESYYIDSCIPIKRNDMIGLYFPSYIPSVSYTFRPPENNFDNTRKCFDEGIRLSDRDVNKDSIFGDTTFKSDVMPYPFEFEAFYYTDAQNASVCDKGRSIPSNRSFVVRPSTPAPNYKGVPGVKGMPGVKGPIGKIGDQGDIGKSGDQGLAGGQGMTGFTGHTGEIGQIGLPGDVGLTGPQGQTGVNGSQGLEGPRGDTGPQGDPGFPGHNYTVVLPKKESVNQNDRSESLTYDPYFSTDTAIWALFIWLAILTFVILLTFLILLASGIWLNKL